MVPSFEYKKVAPEVDLCSAILIVPCVSVGNVGQLSCDLIISSLNMEKIGYIFTNCVLPVVGNDAFSENSNNKSITLAIEVFYSKKNNIAVIQQRSPTVKGMKEKYAECLMSWIDDMKFKKIFLMSSCFAHERIDSEIIGSQMRYLLNKAAEQESYGDEFESLGWKMYKNRPNHVNEENIIIPGGGITIKYLEHSNNSNIPVTALVVFCSEGYNIPDAELITRNLFRCSTFKEAQASNVEFKQPASWKYLFGNPLPSELF